jgi:hypothetical protein
MRERLPKLLTSTREQVDNEVKLFGQEGIRA